MHTIKKLKIFLVILLVQTCSACAIAVPNEPICTEIDIARGWCTYTISNKEFFIDETHPWSPTGDPKDAMTWWELRPTMVQVPYPTWVAIKTFIIKICKDSGKCSGAVSNWERTVGDMDSQLGQKRP